MLDIILLAIIVIPAIKHYRGGLTGVFFGIGRFVLSVISAVLFGGMVGGLLADGVVGSLVSYGAYYKVKEYVDGTSISSFFADPPEGFIRFTRLIGADLPSLKEQYGSATYSDETLRKIAASASRPLTETVSAILGYLAVFLVTFVALTVVIACLKKIKVPLLTSFDKWLGLGLGILLGVFAAALLSTVFYTALEVAAALTGDGRILDFYNDSLIFKFIYDLKIFEFVRNLL